MTLDAFAFVVILDDDLLESLRTARIGLVTPETDSYRWFRGFGFGIRELRRSHRPVASFA